MPPSSMTVEVLRTGKDLNGREWTPEILDQLVASYNPAERRAPVTLDHAWGGPALAWVESLERKGKSLWATITDIAPELYALLKSRAYGPRSVELYGPTEDRPSWLFRAFSFLGALSPAVGGMVPVELAADPANAGLLFCAAVGDPIAMAEEAAAAPLAEESASGEQIVALTAQVTDLQAQLAAATGERDRLRQEAAQRAAADSERAAAALVSAAIAAGRMLPAQREAGLQLAREKPALFESLYGKDAPPVISLSEMGSTGAQEEQPAPASQDEGYSFGATRAKTRTERRGAGDQGNKEK